ncbi:NAD(P)H-dependent FMN reductase [Kribbella aluminosa]|uniref:NAD(P)H-dependent FMN reductase n=1 Tax=Kribbella aluminosa TaxID=416017 RepID=A0ABS4UQ24_9ACTN|nr:NAD(P)H-dependent oxidoreductase [Kribbella aluminosa]MBP2353664.1 NAD(P)H-dependent FMN reductase [Kribbella aluminosa]
MTVHPLRLLVLTRNVEAGRFGTAVTGWFVGEIERADEFKLELIDLSRTPLEELPGRVEDADAVMIVTAEYNHAYPGDVKTAIDAVRRPWYAKPVGFVVYGGRSGGLRAAEQLRLVFGELHAVTIRDSLGFREEDFEDGEPVDPTTSTAAAALLRQLAWWARSLRDARASTPYPG